MLFSVSLLFVLPSLFNGYSASPLDSSGAAGVMKRDATYNCPNYPPPVPFYRAYSSSATDHFYTTNQQEYQNAVQYLGYSAEGNAGDLYLQQEQYTTPLYRLYSSGAADHFYTANEGERNTAIKSLGYSDEGITGYIFYEQVCGAVPLYRMYSAGATDHFYTTSEQEKENAVTYLGYSDEGIVGYVVAQ